MTTLQRPMPQRRDDVWVRQADHETALVRRADGSVHIVNDTALAIWQLCDGETHPNEMIDAICDLSGLPEEVVRDDVHTTLRGFNRAGLIGWTV